MPRSYARFLGALALALMASVLPAACVGNDFTSDGTGGVGASGGNECIDSTDCPGEDLPCRRRSCTGGVCSIGDLPQGQPTTSQHPGDCQRVVCDGQGSEVVTQVTDDPFVDGNACTDDICSSGVPSNPASPAGNPCPDIGNGTPGKCDAGGLCVECLLQADCAAELVCLSGKCVPESCQNGTTDGNETDVDCGGGACLACDDGKQCAQDEDCFSKVCEGTCQQPSCSDGVQNGTETDKDCGGSALACERCQPGQMCAAHADCSSEICIGGVCEQPSCSDGAKNGQESDVDCGGNCAGCATGKMCVDEDDCQSQQCTSGVCVEPCANGVMDGSETDLDCGGPDCPACSDGQSCQCNDDCLSGACCQGAMAGPVASSVCGQLGAAECLATIPCIDPAN